MLILQKNFGDTDYPSLIFSNQSYGMFSLALSSLIFSLILNENFKYSGFFTLLLISVHPVIGLWILLILRRILEILRLLLIHHILIHLEVNKPLHILHYIYHHFFYY